MSNITDETALTAMCVWEELLSIFSQKDESNIYTKKKNKIGACSMRQIALDVIVPSVEKAYAAVSEEFSESFDWEFVPRFLQLAEPIYVQSGFSMSETKAIEIGQAILKEFSVEKDDE